MLNERLGKLHFWLFFVGINVTFFVQHELGLEGMPRRVATYRESDGWGTLNLVSTIGSFILAIGVLTFIVNLGVSLRKGRPAGPDPWGGQTLEWATTSPPPEHNFDSLPPIRSERPLWDLHHPSEKARR
jgi:heme/copper-type cytochrome/quinol oxidase subunit 1